MHRLRRPLAAAAAAVALSAASAARADDWPTPGLDAAHARLSAERSGARFTDGRWTASFADGGRVLATPLAADGYLVTVDLGGALRALRADDGTPLWQASSGATVQGTPAVARGRVFVPTIGNSVVAFRLADGARLWSRDVGGMTLSSPTPVNGDLIVSVGLPQRHVVRLSGATGDIVWQSPDVMQQFGNTSPAVGAGLVVVGANGGHYYAFDVATGAPRWDYVADGIVHLAAPLIAGGRVYMAGGGDSDRVHAVDAATGAAVAGWPITLAAPAPDVAGTRQDRRRAVSSLAAVGGMILLQTRLDDAMDADANGQVDFTLSRESLVALDPASGAVAWQRDLARAQIADPNDVPKFFVCPTPAGFASDGGSALVAAASSLSPAVVVFDAAAGQEQGRLTTSGPALASPVLANGRLIATSVGGTIEGFASSLNHAPAAPVAAANAAPVDSADVTLRWLPAADPDAELPSYEIRIDADGELLETWQQQIFVGQGVTSLHVAAPLADGVKYTFAVRARDARGALSPWSVPETFSVVTNPSVSVGGTPAASLGAALGAAQPGDVITLGAGVYRLSETAHVRAGVALRGAGAGLTTLDASGLPVGVSFDGSVTSHASGLDGLTIHGGGTCIQVSDGTTGVRLSHVIVRDCGSEGIAVRATGGAEVVNATLVGNPTALHAAGATRLRNSLLSGNGTAEAADSAGALTSSYNDLFGNGSDYVGTAAGTGDMSSVVTFAGVGGRDLRLTATQPSTDRGDPNDPVGAEPAPNGGRINLGAFGGTADAELTALSTAVGGPGAPGATPGSDPHQVGGAPTPTPTPAPGGNDDGGCRVAARSDGSGWGGVLLIGVLALAVRRRRGRRGPLK
ncbi:MAG TPA: PQQ-binding-like beta-propeller repeat protein [Polyangia bacterium]|jgi:MYXO-CTERM domain-containing protein